MKKLFNIYFHGSRKSKRVALTFDDGPSEETKKVLDILKENNAKATFFILGKRIKGRENIIKKIVKECHEIGNHSFHHYSLWFKSKILIENEIKKTDKRLEEFGIKTRLFRPPCFRFGFNLLKVCKKLNKKIIASDVISQDWKKPGVEKVINKVLKKVKNGSIINFHDYLEEIGKHKEIILLLENLIPKLKKRGYKMVTISKLLSNSS